MSLQLRWDKNEIKMGHVSEASVARPTKNVWEVTPHPIGDDWYGQPGVNYPRQNTRKNTIKTKNRCQCEWIFALFSAAQEVFSKLQNQAKCDSAVFKTNPLKPYFFLYFWIAPNGYYSYNELYVLDRRVYSACMCMYIKIKENKPIAFCTYGMPNVALFDIFLYFYSIFFIAVVYFYICIQSLFVSIVYILFLFYIRSFLFNICSFLLYMFRFYSIFDHFYVIINDLYAIVFHYYSITSIYIPNFSFVFYITMPWLLNTNVKHRI